MGWCPPPGVGFDLDLPDDTKKEIRDFGDKVDKAGSLITAGLVFVGGAIILRAAVSKAKPSIWKLFK